jgi:hypothetical protein
MSVDQAAVELADALEDLKRERSSPNAERVRDAVRALVAPAPAPAEPEKP